MTMTTHHDFRSFTVLPFSERVSAVVDQSYVSIPRYAPLPFKTKTSLAGLTHLLGHSMGLTWQPHNHISAQNPLPEETGRSININWSPVWGNESNAFLHFCIFPKISLFKNCKYYSDVPLPLTRNFNDNSIVCSTVCSFYGLFMLIIKK